MLGHHGTFIFETIPLGMTTGPENITLKAKSIAKEHKVLVRNYSSTFLQLFYTKAAKHQLKISFNWHDCNFNHRECFSKVCQVISTIYLYGNFRISLVITIRKKP